MNKSCAYSSNVCKSTITNGNESNNINNLYDGNNINNLYEMKKCVWAVLFHNTNIEDPSIRHQFCPRKANSWCLWQADKINGKQTYKPKLSLPLTIKSELLNIF